MSLICIKTRNTGTGTVEVHILSDDSGYRDFTLQTGTPITEDDGNNFAFAMGEQAYLLRREQT